MVERKLENGKEADGKATPKNVGQLRPMAGPSRDELSKALDAVRQQNPERIVLSYLEQKIATDPEGKTCKDLLEQLANTEREVVDVKRKLAESEERLGKAKARLQDLEGRIAAEEKRLGEMAEEEGRLGLPPHIRTGLGGLVDRINGKRNKVIEKIAELGKKIAELGKGRGQILKTLSELEMEKKSVEETVKKLEEEKRRLEGERCILENGGFRWSCFLSTMLKEAQAAIIAEKGPEFAALIRKRGVAGVMVIATELELYEGYRKEENAHLGVEKILKIVFEAEEKSGNQFTELIDALADVFIGLGKEDFVSWSHSLCHLFENYFPGEEGRSFLDSPARLSAAKKLIDETVRRAVEEKRTGCTHRILEPLIDYNLDNITAETLDGDFPFRPDSVTDSRFAGLSFDSFISGDLRRFCTAGTPRDFLVSIVGVPGRDKRKSIAGLMETLQRDTNAKIEMAESAVEEVAGLYVDVDGTLVIGGKLNARVLQTMEKAAEEGKMVRIFTGGNPEKQTARLHGLGVPEKFLPVVQKSDFAGKILEWVIDDARPEYQGFRAKRHDLPDE